MVKKAIKIFLVFEAFVAVTFIFSFAVFINLQVAFLSSFLIILGSAYAYRSLVQRDVALGRYKEDRDLLDSIDDKYELYDDEAINDAPPEELDLKKIVKEEKGKIKTFSLSSMKFGAKGGLSPFRVVPYILLIFGFIALKNNHVLELIYYLPGLLIGIVAATMAVRSVEVVDTKM